jgi:hypothetical protein
MTERCDWDEKRNAPATARHGCKNPAVLSVGASLANNWHLCERCAALPRFKRFRSRVELRPRFQASAGTK